MLIWYFRDCVQNYVETDKRPCVAHVTTHGIGLDPTYSSILICGNPIQCQRLPEGCRQSPDR